MKRQLSKEKWTSIMDGIRRSEKDFKPNIYTPDTPRQGFDLYMRSHSAPCRPCI